MLFKPHSSELFPHQPTNFPLKDLLCQMILNLLIFWKWHFKMFLNSVLKMSVY